MSDRSDDHGPPNRGFYVRCGGLLRDVARLLLRAEAVGTSYIEGRQINARAVLAGTGAGVVSVGDGDWIVLLHEFELALRTGDAQFRASRRKRCWELVRSVLLAPDPTTDATPMSWRVRPEEARRTLELAEAALVPGTSLDERARVDMAGCSTHRSPNDAEVSSRQASALGERADEPGRWAARLGHALAGAFERHGDMSALDNAPAPIDWANPLVAAGVVWGRCQTGQLAGPGPNLEQVVERWCGDTGRHHSWLLVGALAARLDGECGLERFVIARRLESLERHAHRNVIVPGAELASILDRTAALGLVRLHHRGLALRGTAAPVGLSARQLMILGALAEGLTYQDIAGRVGYLHGTVRKEVIAVYALMGVRDRDCAVDRAHLLGLLDRPDDRQRRSAE